MIGRFAYMRPEKRRALLHAVPVVAAVRLALWVVPFRIIHRFILRFQLHHRRQRTDPRELASAVVRVSAHVPDASCLTQAIALYLLLRRNGHGGRIHIGVARAGHGSIKAHAWVELDGVVLIGGGGVTEYTPLVELQEARK